jgi:hypothetical protein
MFALGSTADLSLPNLAVRLQTTAHSDDRDVPRSRTTVSATTPSPSLGEYLDRGKTIWVARCERVGPLLRNLDWVVSIEILHVIKGAGAAGDQLGILVDHEQPEEGAAYLFRSEHDERLEHANGFRGPLAVIRFPKTESIATLQTLPPRTQVLRIFNQRKQLLDDEIRALDYERGQLAKALEKA